MKNKMLKISFVAASSLLVLSGCSGKYDPTPKAVKVKGYRYKHFDVKVSIEKGESFKDVIKKIQNNSKNKIIIDKTKSDIVFTDSIKDLSPKDLFNYIKLNYGVELRLRKYSSRLYVIEELEDKKVEDRITGDLSKIPNITIETKGDMTYEQLFNELRSQNVNIYMEIEKGKDSFNDQKTVKEFKGKLDQLLRIIAAEENLFIEIEKSGICLKDIETRTFDLKLPKVKAQPVLNAEGTSGITLDSTTSQTSNVTNDDGTQTNINNNTSINTSTPFDEESNVDPLEDLKSELDSIFKDNKNVKYNVNKSSGVLTAQASYRDMKTISKIVKKFQDIYNKHIQIEMHVYEITLDDHNAFGIDYSQLENELIGNGLAVTKNISTGLTSILPDDVTGSISATNNSGPVLTVTNPDGTTTSVSQKASGVVFKYLNKFGRAAILTKPTLGTVNNFPVQLDVIDSIDYVYKISQTQTNTATTGTQTNIATAEPEIQTAKTGFSLVLHPRIEGDYIKIAMKNIVSNLNALNQYKYGVTAENPNGNIIQLKDVSAREFAETVKLKEGEMAIIGGFQYTKKVSTKNGLPFTSSADSAFDALTSAKDTTTKKVEIVITLQAVAR